LQQLYQEKDFRTIFQTRFPLDDLAQESRPHHFIW